MLSGQSSGAYVIFTDYSRWDSFANIGNNNYYIMCFSTEMVTSFLNLLCHKEKGGKFGLVTLNQLVSQLEKVVFIFQMAKTKNISLT